MHSALDGKARDQRRPTLALLVSELEQAYQAPIWTAVSKAAAAADVNLLSFVGGRLGGCEDVLYEVQRNSLYDVVNTDVVDGLIVVSSAIGYSVTSREISAFVHHFQPLPTVSLGLAIEGIPSITVDAEHGMRAGIRHLIVEHGARRIAFVRGPEGQFEAEVRYRAYRDELVHHGIPFDADLVAPGDWVSSRRACELLVDERGMSFDALVAANDTMALSAIDELQRRGLRVPDDVAVLGYDDAAGSELSVSPLTTVRQPIAEMGQAAVEMVLSSMRGAPVRDVELPSSLVVRKSCGCVETQRVGASVDVSAVSRVLRSRHLETSAREIGLDLLAAFDNERVMDVLVEQLPRIEVPGCLLALYQHEESDADAASGPTHSLPTWSELALLYRDGRRLSPAEDRRFATRSFVPTSLLPTGRRYDFVVEALTFEDRQLGFLMFESGPYDGAVYGAMRGHLSTALQGARLAGEMARRAAQLQAAVDVVRIAPADAGMDPADLAQSMVDSLHNSLGLHFAGLYLLDDRWATLWAGSGTAGAHMLRERHRLRIGGSSAVGQCAMIQAPQFARGGDGSTIHVGDRYLSDTRSEVALPLVSRGEVLGVLSLRSDNINAFQQSDLTTLTTVADQVAGAIENARLFSRTQEALAELEATQTRYQQQAWADYLSVAPTTDYVLGSRPTEPVDGMSASGVGAESAELVVPITYAGATIGSLGIYDDADRRWTEDEITLVESVVERMGLAAENVRLLDETQRRVAVEQLTQSVTAEMRQSLDVDQVLQAAVRRIAEAFDAAEVSIRLSVGDMDRASEETREADAGTDFAGYPATGGEPSGSA